MTERRARRRPGENRARLLEAGIIIFGTHGFHGASTSDIARHAEVPQPHVYQHFASKSALFVSCVEVVVARLSAKNEQTDRSLDETTDVTPTVVHATNEDLLRFHLQAVTQLGDTHHPVESVSSLLTSLHDALSQPEWEQIVLSGARLFTRGATDPRDRRTR